MKLFGLTGGISSGKSTVEGFLKLLGCHIIDADQLYHALLLPNGTNPSPLSQKIAAVFPGVLLENGTIDRQSLAEIVFKDEKARKTLEQITHPAVAEAFGQHLASSKEDGREHCIYSVPLLYENKLEANFEGVIVVWVPEDVQKQRLAERDKLSPRHVEERLAAQLPLEEKKQKADWVIDNSGSLEQTQKAVQEIWAKISTS